jgi:hypothetical protein
MHSYVQTRPALRNASGNTGAAEQAGTHVELRSPAPESAGAKPLNESPQSQSLLRTRQALDEGPRVQSQLALQRALNPGGAKPAQAGAPGVSKRKKPLQPKPNATGLPDYLKAGVKQLSGFSMDDVRVHYNSANPAQLQALAYAQGTDIYLAPGQEQHLPHETWHVVQQKQNRVKPTLQVKGVAINDDGGLEREADARGNQAAQTLGFESLSSQARERVESRNELNPPILQFVRPKNGQPDVPLYSPRKDHKPYTLGGRKKMYFHKTTRDFIRNRHLGAPGSQNIFTQTTSGPVPLMVEAVQLDHLESWQGIEQELFGVAEELTANTRQWQEWMSDYYVADKDGKYNPTMYAARMYYNDVSNLQPMTGGKNASKGGISGDEMETKSESEVNPEAEVNEATKLHMMQIQDMVDEARAEMADKAPPELSPVVSELIGRLEDFLSALNEDYPPNIGELNQDGSVDESNQAGGMND